MVGGKLKTLAKVKMKNRSQTPWCIGCRADKSRPDLLVRDWTDVEKYVTGTNSSPEYLSDL